MSHPGVEPPLIDVLNRASSLQLFQLNSLIERMLGGPRRIIAVRVNMHLGQTVRFIDWRDGSLREGRVLAMKDTQVTLQDCAGLISTDTSIGGIHLDGEHDQEAKTDIQHGVQAASCANH